MDILKIRDPIIKDPAVEGGEEPWSAAESGRIRAARIWIEL